jgi:glycolate oxidase FAD binding subunit
MAGFPSQTFRDSDRMTEIASENEVVAAVREARATKSPFEIVGAGSKQRLGRASSGSTTVLNVAGVKGIVSYEPEELILTVRPGTPVAEIVAVLEAKGQRLGFDPPDWGPLLGAAPGIGTIGGAISADASGPARVRYGAVRDQLLGFRAVNGLGEVFKAGGKVVKNVTGFDIPKLVCGAFGTLCVLTEVTLRVFPKPSRSQTLVIRGVAPEDGFALLRKVWASPLEATGLAYADGSALFRLEGEEAPLRKKIGMLKILCGGRDIRAGEETVFRGVANGDTFLQSGVCVWRIAVPPSHSPAVVEGIGSSLWVGDCAGGILWIATDDHQRVRGAAKAAAGHAILLRADAQTRATIDVFEAEDPVRAQLTRSVKAAFDPLGLFNPGRMWDGV